MDAKPQSQTGSNAVGKQALTIRQWEKVLRARGLSRAQAKHEIWRRMRQLEEEAEDRCA